MANETSIDLATTLGRLAVEMQDLRDVESVLQMIVAASVDVVPGARWAGISQAHGRNVEPRSPSDPLVMKIDSLQSELGEGPCISSLRDHRTVVVDDMSAETRWPRFAEAALALGVHSSMSFQLFVIKDNLGALNLYGGEPGVFDDESLLYGETLAQHASVAMADTMAVEQFHRALASRDIIGQAKGVLMERFGVDAVRAFALLTRLSQDGNIKLFEVAERVVSTSGSSD
ncbi:GAF and ANTAR domain-containing protein [Mycobacterium yunnanensis]|uniref:GAF and ANTAR domain-containing protein n=1 Tax=Mycobacterium yunnanensis TaxID=368477 RepID=A0A9X2Z1N3_9MYCO|nr:GAF and ANTAR domain-containing protein [Mycobacterium yunnanensis]MCV7421276.1 GAF and ANTAR domain-containing protein [Mycobacterium yunnanensis]